MNPERRVAIVTDSTVSIRPEDKEVQELGVTIVPLRISFFENNQFVDYADLDIKTEEFYRKMRASKYLPRTSGAVSGRIAEVYKELREEANAIISIHISSRHSVAWQSAVLGAKSAREEIPELSIEVIDSRQISLGTWFSVAHAAKLAQDGARLEEIKKGVLEIIPKIEFLATLSTLKNIIRGGRVPALTGYLGSLLRIMPILTIKDGELQEVGKMRTVCRARRELVRRVEDEEEEIVKMAILHTHDYEGAQEVREALAKFYPKHIPIHDAGPVLGVHGGEGAVGVVFQKA